MITANHKDLAPERQERLRELVRERGIMRVDELSDLLKVSSATVRRDLEELEGQGGIRRVHGGAVSTESRLEEPLFDDKTSLAVDEKRRIAVKAASFVEPGDTVFLDGGSTVLEMARLLADRTGIIVVTNSLRASIELSGRGPEVILIGGELRRRSQTIVGPLTFHTINQLHIDKAFMGTMGLTLDQGLTTTDPQEAFTKDQVMKHSGQVFLLADSSKIGKIFFARSGDLGDLDIFITDKQIKPAVLRSLKKFNLNVVKT